MELPRCPLGYDCINPAACFQASIGIDPAAAIKLRATELIIDDRYDNAPLLRVCSGLVRYGPITPEAQLVMRLPTKNTENPVIAIGNAGLEAAVSRRRITTIAFCPKLKHLFTD
ncbi:MAG TPA: hypothetical protein VLH38_01465 [Patescibacteria group bacterium]|nr:hypothetical protein [Patescibacteria group bacterium]